MHRQRLWKAGLMKYPKEPMALELPNYYAAQAAAETGFQI